MHLKHKKKKTSDTMKKWMGDLNRHFPKNTQMPKKHMKRCSTSLMIKEMQIKTTMSYHLTPVRMAIIKKYISNTCCKGCGEKKNLLHYWRECELVHPLWRTVWRFLKKLKLDLPYIIKQSHSWAYIQRKP